MLIVEQNCLRTHGTSWVILRAEISRRRSKMFMQWLRPLETLGVCTCHMCHTNAVFVPCTGCTCQSISDISFINNDANCNANWREVCLGVEPMFGAICLLSLVDIPCPRWPTFCDRRAMRLSKVQAFKFGSSCRYTIFGAYVLDWCHVDIFGAYVLNWCQMDKFSDGH